MFGYTLVLCLIQDLCFPKHLLNSLRLTITRLKLLHLSLEQMKLNSMYSEFMEFQSERNHYMTSHFIYQALEHKTKEIRNEGTKCFKSMCDFSGIDKMRPWLAKLKKESHLYSEVVKSMNINIWFLNTSLVILLLSAFSFNLLNFFFS